MVPDGARGRRRLRGLDLDPHGLDWHVVPRILSRAALGSADGVGGMPSRGCAVAIPWPV